ncbi:chemotaxis protein CheW [Herbaspirillum sp. YR522]|uniref:chemotaxis protein CheW n=1 Tax=Herbaspirillum sp. YR522 TaxID=1144342 RepID=UPI00026F5CA9|nr:chemotaxis protein CheW [Herbaspirillum sp. YR522]EJN03559.1 chemotaxis signal transduction protein [Herbaspirillum sp. YR522]
MAELARPPSVWADRIDDCWNRIGVRGDHSCPQLLTHHRCLNCPTYASAALVLLDRPVESGALAQEWAQSAEQAAQYESAGATNGVRESALVFRVGAEWLALSTAAVLEVADSRPVHSLPHQRNGAVLGVLNIRGALRICISLAALFEIVDASIRNSHRPYMVVALHEAQTLVFPVDEVAGVQRFDADDVEPVPTTLAQLATPYARGLLDWRGRKVGLLDHGLLFYALARAMT